jgi:predicted transcriptional regulator
MPTARLSMRRIRQLLALHFGAGASTRAIGQELGIAPSTVREYLARAKAAEIGWPLGGHHRRKLRVRREIRESAVG